MYPVEPKEGGGGRSVALLYCLLLSAWYFMIQSQIEWIILLWHISWRRRNEAVEGEWASCTVYFSLQVLYDAVTNGVEHLATNEAEG
jgi:hypothetical protein